MQPLLGGSMMMPMQLSVINEHGAVSNGACEVVSRQLRVWAEAGLVATQRGALQLLKPDILQAIAEPLGGE